VEIDITPRQDADISQAEPMLEIIDPDAFLADRAYDADRLINRLTERGITVVIPPKCNRTTQRETDFALYRERNLVERFFNKLRQFRAIATRYDKLKSTFLTAVQFASIIILLNSRHAVNTKAQNLKITILTCRELKLALQAVPSHESVPAAI
jgi:transposase